MELAINGKTYTVPDEQENRMLVWVLRDELGMTGTKFGCGVAVCGSCTVLLDGEPTRSCVTQVKTVVGKQITTLEGLSHETSDGNVVMDPVQQAFLEIQTPQCSWCMTGQMMTAVALLEKNPSPAREEVAEAMSVAYCRCGTYMRIRQAVLRAAEIKAEGK